MAKNLPDTLIDPDWLVAHLDEPGLRVIECTVYLRPAPPETDLPYQPVPGREDFEAAHIPGAVFADLVNDLSLADAAVHFMLPPPDDFARAAGRLGIADGTRVVIYSRDRLMWSTRLWWMLHVMGFDDAAVLDGGFEAWQAAGGPVESGPGRTRPETFTARPRPGLMVDAAFTRQVIDHPSTLLINTLTEREFRGEGPSRYGRPGRIPGSVSLPWPELVGEDGAFVPPAELSRQLESVGAGKAREIVCYCGGGISATMALFHLHRLGHRNLRLYDASLAEWAKDPDLPIEAG